MDCLNVWQVFPFNVVFKYPITKPFGAPKSIYLEWIFFPDFLEDFWEFIPLNSNGNEN